MIAALSFLLDYEKIQDDDDSDDSGSDDEAKESPQVALSRQTLYKVMSNDHHPTNFKFEFHF